MVLRPVVVIGEVFGVAEPAEHAEDDPDAGILNRMFRESEVS